MSMGKLIVVDGVADGCGKTTVVNILNDEYRKVHYNSNILITKACGGSPVSKMFRETYLNNNGTESDNTPMSLMFQFTQMIAGIVELSEYVIKPALARGENVIVDRWWISSYAYQIYGTSLFNSVIPFFIDVVKELPIPDFTVICHASHRTCATRIMERDVKELNKFDELALSEINRIRDGYEFLIGMNQDNFYDKYLLSSTPLKSYLCKRDFMLNVINTDLDIKDVIIQLKDVINLLTNKDGLND